MGACLGKDATVSRDIRQDYRLGKVLGQGAFGFVDLFEFLDF